MLSGHEAMETVYLMNNEDQPFHFNFDEDSTHSAGYSAQLYVEPMAGQIPAKSRYVQQVSYGSWFTFMYFY